MGSCSHVASRISRDGLLFACGVQNSPRCAQSWLQSWPVHLCTWCTWWPLGDHLETTWRAQSAVLHASVMPFFIHILHNHFYSYVVSNIFIHNWYRTVPEIHSSIVPESFIKYLQDSSIVPERFIKYLQDLFFLCKYNQTPVKCRTPVKSPLHFHYEGLHW